MGSADASQAIRALLGLYSVVKLLPTIAQKVQDGPFTPNTAQFLWLELSQRQSTNRVQFYYLIVSYSNRMQKKKICKRPKKYAK